MRSRYGYASPEPDVNSPAYQLCRDVTDLQDEGTYDVVLSDPPGWHTGVGLDMSLVPFTGEPLPEEVVLWGSLARVRELDILHLPSNLKVISTRLYLALLRQGDFPHRAIPVVVREAKKGRGAKKGREEALAGAFVVLVITKTTPGLDRERSRYDVDANGNVEFIHKWVFHDPATLPSVFKVQEALAVLLVRGTCVAALPPECCRGVEWVPAERLPPF